MGHSHDNDVVLITILGKSAGRIGVLMYWVTLI